MKAYLWVALAGVCGLAAPLLARNVQIGEASDRAVKREDACRFATEVAWSDRETSSVGNCRCQPITVGGVNGYKCFVTLYANVPDESPYRGNNSSGGNIYNNPYGGTTTVLPGVR